MIRQMQYTVRRIRTNVSRMHTQLISVDNVATQVPLLPRPIIQSMNQSAPAPEFTVQQMQMNKEIIQEIEQRLYSTSRKINDIVIRLNASLDGSNDVGGKIIADNNGQQHVSNFFPVFLFHYTQNQSYTRYNYYKIIMVH